MRNLALKNAKGRGRGRSRVAAFAEEGRKSIQQVPLREIKLHQRGLASLVGRKERIEKMNLIEFNNESFIRFRKQHFRKMWKPQVLAKFESK